jgi:hypothetical protein
VIVATGDGWETVRGTYESIRPQAEEHQAEVVLVDSSGGPAPLARELGPTTRWIQMPGSDIAEMRMRAYREARGRIIAMTEDHVVVAPDWVASMLGAHADHPEAAAVGGAVRNGSQKNAVDWASFYAGHAPYIEPLPTGPTPYLSGVNVSYKREPLRAVLDRSGDRAIETLINDDIKANGGTLVADGRLVVTHFQSRGILATTRLHYYAGRHFEGTRRSSRRNGPLRAARAAALPLPRVTRRVIAALRRGQPASRVVRIVPAALMLATAQAAGEIVGALRGPGQSASKLH